MDDEQDELVIMDERARAFMARHPSFQGVVPKPRLFRAGPNVTGWTAVGCMSPCAYFFHPSDAVFFIEATTDIPALVQEYRALVKENAELRRQLNLSVPMNRG